MFRSYNKIFKTLLNFVIYYRMKKNYYEPPLWEDEEWKPAVGYEGLYEVSNLGNVRGVNRMTYRKGVVRCLKGKIRKPQIISTGYKQVQLSKDGKVKGICIHRLVAEAFIPNPDNLPCVNHKDEDKTNNNVENLEWCSFKYNSNYGTSISRMVDTKIKKGIYDPQNIGLPHKEIVRNWRMKHRIQS